MPKDKFTLSKKHEYLIDKISEIPTIEDIVHCAWSNDMPYIGQGAIIYKELILVDMSLEEGMYPVNGGWKKI